MILTQNILIKCLLKNNSFKAYILIETIVSLVIISLSFLTLSIFSNQIYKNIILFEKQKDITFTQQQLNKLLKQSSPIISFANKEYKTRVKDVVKFDENLQEITIESNGIILKAYK